MAAVATFDEALAALRLRRPQVAMVDIAALGPRGLAGLAELRAARSQTAILAMGIVDDPALAHAVDSARRGRPGPQGHARGRARGGHPGRGAERPASPRPSGRMPEPRRADQPLRACAAACRVGPRRRDPARARWCRAPGADSISCRPPASRTRSRMPMSPKPSLGVLHREPAPVVGHRDLDRAVALDDGDADPLRAGVLGDVRQRLLDDAVDRGLDRAVRAGSLVPRLEPRSTCSATSMPDSADQRSTSASSAGPTPSWSSDAGRMSVMRLRIAWMLASTCSIACATAAGQLARARRARARRGAA